MTKEKVIVVEGKTDKEKLEKLLDEPVEILCTNGTVGIEQMEELILQLEDRELFILVDADESGNKLRKQLKREFPNAKHLYTHKVHREVARTPNEELRRILQHAHFQLCPEEEFFN